MSKMIKPSRKPFPAKPKAEDKIIHKIDDSDVWRKDGLHLVILGGTGEFGLNFNMYCCNGKWIIVDVGAMFDDQAGITVFVPKIDFLRSIPPQDIIGIFITHGHEDHHGAIPYLWKYIKKDIYATPFTAGLLRKKIKEMRTKEEGKIIEIVSGERVQAGPFDIQYVGVTHSIPDNCMIIIRTEHGNVLHTGDWRFDEEPTVGEVSDTSLLEKFGDEGVAAVVCDSTNAMTPGNFASETDVKNTLESLIAGVKKGRVVVVCFSTNLARVDSCARIAQHVGRRVALVGRSLHRIKEVALESGYLKGLPDFLTEDAAKTWDPDKLLIVCTGSQGEINSGLYRLANGEHPKIDLQPGDTVILSARMITGKEKEINNMLNKLAKKGINIITRSDEPNIHVSGHPPQDDLRRLYSLVRPKCVIPVHGEVRNLMAQREFAESLGYKSILLENGAVVEITKNSVAQCGKVVTGQMGLDGKFLVNRDGKVIAEREWLENGAIFVSILVHNPEEFNVNVITAGVLEPHENKFRYNLRNKVEYTIKSLSPSERLEHKKLMSSIRSSLQNYMYLERGTDPSIFVSSFVLGRDDPIDIVDGNESQAD